MEKPRSAQAVEARGVRKLRQTGRLVSRSRTRNRNEIFPAVKPVVLAVQVTRLPTGAEDVLEGESDTERPSPRIPEGDAQDINRRQVRIFINNPSGAQVMRTHEASGSCS